ncbi:hypothetical protein OICFNHDK_3725 [Methylobacterium bullatum]|uniref:Uncharacterized protein n=3 Tax=Methylobacteriaceae TaxID=119045 RepID=A0A679KGW0_9HYPH|nr:hypothetical protein [Methylobacterium bullatum]GJD41243.1 hypothetical protein OICFNHDK_3725 [Methylobacterium bullatum]CAA2144275.1 hypothetical protein MBLL_03395 [Methylobacterium bullatum]
MVTGMQGTPFVIVAILALTLLVARELIRATHDTHRKARALERANADLNRCFDVTERALKDDRVPDRLRNLLLGQAHALSDFQAGERVLKAFIEMLHSRRDVPSPADHPIALAVEELAASDPRLAAECRSALVDGMLALILIHADAFSIDEAVDEAVHEAARNPFSVPADVSGMLGGSGLAAA